MPSASESSLANVGGAAVWDVVLLVHRRFVCVREIMTISLLCRRYWNHDETNNLPSRHEDTNDLNKVKNSISQFFDPCLAMPITRGFGQVGRCLPVLAHRLEGCDWSDRNASHPTRCSAPVREKSV